MSKARDLADNAVSASADKAKIDAIEALADVTDVTNVTTAGALMDSEVTNLAQVKAFATADYATAAQGTLAGTALQPAGDGSALTGLPPAFNPVAVTGTTPSLNVGSYNFFSQGTTTADTTVSFASVPTNAKWSYSYVVGSGAGFDLTNSSFTGIRYSTAHQASVAGDLFFKSDGLSMYVAGNTSVYQYLLITPWLVSSAIFVRSFSIGAQDGFSKSIFFKPDGLEMYVRGGDGNDINQYTLSTAWDISSATFTRVSTADATVPGGLFFKSDGLELYYTRITGYLIVQYTLSTPWDISTATQTRTLNISTYELAPKDVHFSSDGLTMMLLGAGQDKVHKYTLSTAWDISSATYVTTISVLSQESSVTGFDFDPDGKIMYIYGSKGTLEYINQYATADRYALTLPAAVVETPSAPLAGKRVTYDFFTLDAGVTVNLIGEEIV